MESLTKKDYALLEEYLLSGMTQKAFAESKGVRYNKMNSMLWQQAMRIYKNYRIQPKGYPHLVSYAKKNKNEILKVIQDSLG